MRWGVYAESAHIRSCLQDLQQADRQTSYLIVRRDHVVDELAHGLPRVELCTTWEQLLGAQDLFAIMVQGDSEVALTALRQLARVDCPLYLWAQADQGLSTAYEMSLFVDERTAPIYPLWMFQGDATLVGLRARLQSAECRVEHLELQRTGDTQGLTDAELDRTVARHRHDDLALLRWLGLRVSRVTALDSSRPQMLHRRLTITLNSEEHGNGLWTCEFAPGLSPAARLTIQTSQGEFRLEQSSTGTWQMLSESPGLSAVGGTQWLDPDSRWSDAVEVFEWIDGVERSLKRRRTIELHNEPFSERAIFKSQMVAGGCGVLMATFAMGLIYLAIGETVPLPLWALQLLRALVFAPLFLFLVAQLLLPLTRPATGQRS